MHSQKLTGVSQAETRLEQSLLTSEISPQSHYSPSRWSEKPNLHVHSSRTHLRCRPAELYLGASTSRRQLHLSVSWDGNVYDETIVKEWLEEVKNAAEWYFVNELGQQAKL